MIFHCFRPDYRASGDKAKCYWCGQEENHHTHLRVPPHEWNFIRRTEAKSRMDNEIKTSKRNKLKLKPQQQKVKIKRRIMKQIDITGKYSPMPNLTEAKMDALVEWYNKHSGSTKLIRFSNREVAIRKCTELKNAMDQLAAYAYKSSTKPVSKDGKTDMSKKAKTAKGKSAAKTSKKAATKGKGGPKLALLDHTLHKLVDKNPRREGTHGFKSWQAIKSGMTYRAAIDAGARNKDIRHDVTLKRLELRPPKAKAATPKVKKEKKTATTIPQPE